ncbi:Alpha/Beta hydrolase protein [Protomyces lactucae-debilis]|uniref:Carboxylic ester hydrolase n=1 Tax=Protomyces lactucae-debilis TaxID=2754530 RepID=A0A1Y2FK79_PROLT|nr:Alpha/Beta hydrolase protein [Protomyces lactucae-debilis]ORY84381.1 Alpha/Beta hydrolase protein [Protomyces lactucae-debilis]
MQVFTVLASLSAVLAAVNDSLTITTNVGTFKGIPQSTGVRAWLGIPFGAKPERFRPPRRASILPQNVTFNATQYGPGCPQNKGASYTALNSLTNGTLGNFTEREDCLSLNIWAPSVERLNSSKPAAVIVYFYGGAFSFGGSAADLYNGSTWVQNNDDIIYCTFNYRMNLLGFPIGAPEVPPNQVNVGLYDQRLAVEWVYNNIRHFGGDPERITLHGESAGSASIATWQYAYEFDPIASGLILQSGSEISLANRTSTNSTAKLQAWNVVANASGCPLNQTANGTAQQFACMQQVPLTNIRAAVNNLTSLNNVFQPQIDNLTVFSTQEYLEKQRTGRYARIPMLVGTNDNEGTILTGLYPYPITPADLTKQVYTCVTALQAHVRTNASVPVWQYRYLARYPQNINLVASLGVYHSSELPLVFGNFLGLPNVTAEQRNLSSTIQGGWSAFAKSPAQGLTQYGWPEYNTTGKSLIQLTNAGVTFNASASYNEGCQNFYPQLKV